MIRRLFLDEWCEDPEIAELRAIDAANRRYQRELTAHPDCRDPDHPGCPDCMDSEEDQDE